MEKINLGQTNQVYLSCQNNVSDPIEKRQDTKQIENGDSKMEKALTSLATEGKALAAGTKVYKNVTNERTKDNEVTNAIVEDVQNQLQFYKKYFPVQVKCDTQQMIEFVNALNIEEYDKSICSYIANNFFLDSDYADLNIDELTLYLKSIDFNEIKKMAPDFKNTPLARLNFAAYHCNKGTVDFTQESLTFPQKLTDYFKTKHVSAQEVDWILSSHPLTSRQIGTIPEDWLTKSSSNEKAQEEIYDAISAFNTDRETEKLSDSLKKLSGSLSRILNKKTDIKECGHGQYGTCYKISIEGAKDTCLKVFHGKEKTAEQHRNDAYNYSGIINQGPHYEPQTAIFLNEYSNDFVKMHFGQVSPFGENTGFMVTDYLSDESEPINVEPKKFNGKLKLTFRDGDTKDNRNAINGKVVDFGGVEVSVSEC